MPRYHRLGHMLEVPMVKVGQWVKRGTEQLGKCGSTGDSTGPHCHYDCPLVNLSYSKWRAYVRGMSKAQVKAQYADPKPFINGTFPMKAQYPLIGYHYLQPVGEKGGTYFHPGEDLNGIDDLGKAIFSPVEGRVVCVGVDDVGAMKAKAGSYQRKALERQLNGGWGYFVVIEEKPGFKIT